jgi:hypothetical protein
METSAKKKPAQAGTTPQKRRPVHTIRVEDVGCSIWDREVTVQGNPKLFYSCTFERSYKDRDGTWKYTSTIDADSLGKLVTAAQQAAEYIADLQHNAGGQ